MARFFFHVGNGDELRDDAGMDLNSLKEAREEALLTASELLGGDGPFWSLAAWSVRVTDEAGKRCVQRQSCDGKAIEGLAMTAKSKPSYRVYEEHGSGRWRGEIATAEGQVIERGRARSAIEARAEAVRRGLGKTQSPDSGSKHKSEGDSGAASSA